MANVLIVDDHLVNRQFLVKLLGYYNHHLVEASDGMEALEKARAERPDLVVTDLLMPIMDGYEFVRHLRADPAINQTPVIFCTAHYLLQEAQTLAQACGVVHVLTKPCRPEVIINTVNEALGLMPIPDAFLPVEEFQREHLRLLTNKVSQKTQELGATNLRLEALIELGQQLALEYDLRRLLENFCHKARKIIGARYAATGMLDEAQQKLHPFLTSGLDSDPVVQVGTTTIWQGFFGRLLSERRPLRLRDLSDDPLMASFSASRSGAHAFLGAPIATATQLYGAFCMIDKLGAEEFTEEDERLITTLAAQVAVACENLQRYADLQRRATALESANKELETFSYSVSHDLRAPLRAIDGFARILLEEYLGGLDEEGQRILQVICSNARQMGHLIDNLLDFSRLSRQHLESSEINMTELVRQVIDELQKREPERDISLIIQPLPVALGNQAMIRQVWVNLLANALKFTHARPQPAVEIGWLPEGSETVYYVKDNGAGFDMKYIHKLFGVFQRLHSDTEFEGTGVGLAIVQRIIHRHGGRIWAEGRVGEGATFYFLLPGTEG